MNKKHTVYVVSGGVGSSGEQLVRTVLAQFPNQDVELEVIPRVRSREKIKEITAQAAQDGALVVYTMVNNQLRQTLTEQLAQHTIPAVDLMGELVDHFSRIFGQQPSGIPGLYRQLHQSYFERVAAIDYSLEHDDGIDPAGWQQADVLLIGPSRTGKTPISMYLAVTGWKAANYPIVPGFNLPQELEQLEPARVIGLTIDPVRLEAHRTQRQKRLGTLVRDSEYTDLQMIYQELEEAERFYRQAGYRHVDVTDKPIETCADEVLRLIPNRE
ncbi:MAG TPA: transcriptional regulator [Chloroflexi bacterium]|nr:transcriptional regulator [Chloroflexota bacterium]